MYPEHRYLLFLSAMVPRIKNDTAWVSIPNHKLKAKPFFLQMRCRFYDSAQILWFRIDATIIAWFYKAIEKSRRNFAGVFRKLIQNS